MGLRQSFFSSHGPSVSQFNLMFSCLLALIYLRENLYWEQSPLLPILYSLPAAGSW